MGDFDEYRISNQDLRENDIPGSRAPWRVTETFALSFDGYKRHGSFARCANMANRCQKAYAKNRTVPETLDALRTCLFFEQRRWRHFEAFPDAAGRRYIGALLAKIRSVVRSSRSGTKKKPKPRNRQTRALQNLLVERRVTVVPVSRKRPLQAK